MKQVELARLLGWYPSKLSDMELKESIQIADLKKIAEVLGIPIENFLIEDQPEDETVKEERNYYALPFGLRQLLESEQGKALKISQKEIEALAAVGERYGKLSKEGYIDILLDIRREEGKWPWGGE